MAIARKCRTQDRGYPRQHANANALPCRLMTTEGDLWHIVEAKREDGADAIFRIRELEPKAELTKIFVIEWPYPITQLSNLPDVAAYRRLSEFEEKLAGPRRHRARVDARGLEDRGRFVLPLSLWRRRAREDDRAAEPVRCRPRLL